MPLTPTVRLKFLSIYMREARLRAGVEPREVAKLLGRDTTRVTKMEKGREGLTPGDAKMLLDRYDVHTDEQKSEIVDLARTRSQRGRWSGHRSIVPLQQRPYYDFEVDSDLIQHYGIEMVPGLLQTEDYMRAALARHFRTESFSVDDIVATRLERQEVLFRQRPAEAAFVLSESCLRRMFGGNLIMHAQLGHLEQLSRRRNVRIQVLPFDSAVSGGTPFSFTMLRVPAPTSAPPLNMVYVENLHDADYLDGDVEVADYSTAWSRLTADALGLEQSRRFIHGVAQQYA
ncbi:helix-turn-helix transcriptional regulator [Saccharothrix violaceirubra]|uniref:Plasmid maintenance system antidote protein VapI n=1 Tax=Saccharothrix violaceirubra TaxID=413306 RepID=A0A7W7SZ24_9PSEU|nr:helix-turn-helix transcriptional regulator [Saccharothrix violaceirubra]MBB4963326.1 plasmid maintenance system antidote protein VapI [Saccharothrix violaceirubra]